MSEWKEYKLGEVSKFSQGIQVPIEEQKNLPFNGGVRFIRIIDFTNNDIKDIRYISDPGSKYLVEKDDLVMIRYGSQTAGKVARGFRGVIANNTFKITPDETILDKGYLFYLLSQKSIYDFFRSSQSSTTMPAITFGQVGDLKIKVPPINTQVIIANILSSLDDKINLNNKINQELESLAQLLFKRWFVDFDFPNENGEPYRSSGGEMVDSEMGEIPKGWTVCKIEKILEIKGGTTPSTKEPQFWDGEFNWTSPRDLSDLKFPLLLRTDKKITSLGLSKVSSGLLPKGTLLLSSRAPIGYLAITEIETAINQGYIAINCKNGYSNLFMLNWLKQNMETVIARANGSTFLEISKSNFREILIVKPELEIHDKYITQVSLMFESLKCNLKENEKLITIRDLLLPKLISGELQINDN